MRPQRCWSMRRQEICKSTRHLLCPAALQLYHPYEKYWSHWIISSKKDENCKAFETTSYVGYTPPKVNSKRFWKCYRSLKGCRIVFLSPHFFQRLYLGRCTLSSRIMKVENYLISTWQVLPFAIFAPFKIWWDFEWKLTRMCSTFGPVWDLSCFAADSQGNYSWRYTHFPLNP